MSSVLIIIITVLRNFVNFVGTIPSSIGLLTGLIDLQLWGNYLVGTRLLECAGMQFLEFSIILFKTLLFCTLKELFHLVLDHWSAYVSWHYARID